MSDPILLEDNFVLVITDQGVAVPTAHHLTHRDGGTDELLLTMNQISNAGTMATQNANSVTITGGTISAASVTAATVNLDGGTIDGVVIGGSSRAAGSFTTVVGTDGTFSGGVSGTTGTFTSNVAITGTLAVTGAVTFASALPVLQGGTGVTSLTGFAATLGIGTMGTQNKTSVDIEGGTIDATTIGGTTPYPGSFTTLTASTGYNGVIGAATPAAGSFTNLTVTGTVTLTTDLPVTQGGTGASTLTGIVTGSGTSALTGTTSSVAGQVLLCTGANTFGFGAVDLDDADAVTGTLAIANGGTNAATAAAARTNLGIISGRATLNGAGTVSVADTNIDASTSIVVVTAVQLAGSTGTLSVALTTGVGFAINSAGGTDASIVAYVVIY